MDTKSQHPPQEGEPAGHNENQPAPPGPSWFRRIGADGWTAVFTGVLTIFTVLLFFVAQDANRLADNSNAAMVQTQRAYVHHSLGNVAKIVDGGNVIGLQIQVMWKNSGSTPATDADSQVNWQPYPNSLLDTFDFRDMPTGSKEGETRRLVIGPSGTASLGANIRIDFFQRAIQGEHLYVWGWITYRDVFADTSRRLTEFCTELSNIQRTDGSKSLTDPAGNITFSPIPCPGNRNCYDESCPDYQARVKK